MKVSRVSVLIFLDSDTVVFHLAMLSMSMILASRVSGAMLTVASRSQIFLPCSRHDSCDSLYDSLVTAYLPCSPSLLLITTSPCCFSTLQPSSPTISMALSKHIYIYTNISL